MKYRCTVSHEEPQEGGGFKRYEAGQDYDGDFEGNSYFEKINPPNPPLKLRGGAESPSGDKGGGVKETKEVTENDN